jgi:hypothetical protein
MSTSKRTNSASHWLAVGLPVAGAVAGALFGIALTPLGKIIGGAPPAGFRNYAWNATVFGVMAAIVSPIVTFGALRRVPLWRTVAEPLTLAVVGGVVATVVGSGVLLLALPPAGLAAGFFWLARRYPQEPVAAASLPTAHAPRRVERV